MSKVEIVRREAGRQRTDDWNVLFIRERESENRK